MSISELIYEKIRKRKKVIPFLFLLLPLGYLLVFFFSPMAITLLFSFEAIDRFYRLTFNFTFKYYLQSFNPDIMWIFGRSLLIAGLTAISCFLLGYPVAYTIAIKIRKYRNVLMMMVILPYWVSFLLRVYALMNILMLLDMYVFGKLGFTVIGTIWGVIIGMIYDYIPFMILPLYASVEKLDVSLIEASQTLGAGPLRTFFHVTLPLTMPGVAAGIILVFVPCIGEFLVPYFLGGPSEYMIGNVIWDLFLKVRSWWFGSAVSTVMIAITLAIVLVYMKYGGGEMAF
jgi:ABC-type spermidine/putrescine transport system permease subunit I